MRFYENRYMGPWMNAPGTSNPWYMSPGAQKSPYYQEGTDPMFSGALAYPMIYPDIYYKLQPYIINAGDRMEMYGGTPTEQMVDRMVDEIREEVMKIHPEIGEYAKEYTENMPMRQEESVPTQTFPGRFQDFRSEDMQVRDEDIPRRGLPGYPGRFEPSPMFPRRGIFNDLIRILLLSELRRRRRRRYY